MVIGSSTDIKNTNLIIFTSTSFSKDYILRGVAASGSVYADIPIKVTVCGGESITLKDSVTPVIVNGLLSSGVTSYELSESTMVDYFTITSTAFCGKVTFSLFTDDTGLSSSVWTSNDVQLDGNLL